MSGKLTRVRVIKALALNLITTISSVLKDEKGEAKLTEFWGERLSNLPIRLITVVI